jgi:hypothetical protein
VYSGLEMKVGFGYGRTAKIPWITFLGKEQTPQNGISFLFTIFSKIITN